MEAEYAAYSLATQEAIWLSSFLQDLGLTPQVDDHVEILYVKDPSSTERLSISRGIIILLEMP